MHHELKIYKEHYQNIDNATKKAEIRINDRGYKTGDTALFYNPLTPSDIGLLFRITHVHSGYGMAEGFVCLSLEPVF